MAPGVGYWFNKVRDKLPTQHHGERALNILICECCCVVSLISIFFNSSIFKDPRTKPKFIDWKSNRTNWKRKRWQRSGKQRKRGKKEEVYLFLHCSKTGSLNLPNARKPPVIGEVFKWTIWIIQIIHKTILGKPLVNSTTKTPSGFIILTDTFENLFETGKRVTRLYV